MKTTQKILIAALLTCSTASPVFSFHTSALRMDVPTQKTTNYKSTVLEIAEAIETTYPIADTAERISESLHAFAKQNDMPTTETAFLKLLNQTLWDAANDLHLKVYSETMLEKKYRSRGMRLPKMRRIPATRGGNSSDIQPASMRAGEALGTSLVTGSMITPTTGLLTFNSAIYNNPDVFEDALGRIKEAENIVIDLRKVPGGSMPGVQLLMSQFFSEPTHISSSMSRRFKKPQELWTIETTLGKEFANKTVYLLTSKRSASGAEAVAFGLKNTGRAILVGEKTAGAGNAGAFLPLPNDLTLFLPMSQTINPRTGEAWEGQGVSPHIEAEANNALQVTLKTIAEKA